MTEENNDTKIGRPSKGKTLRKQLLFKKDLVERIQIYQHKHMLNSFTAAVMALVEESLDIEGFGKE